MGFYHRRLLLGAKGPGDKPEPHCTKSCCPGHSIPTVLVLSLGIIGAAFLFLSYFAIRRFASRRRNPPPNLVYNNNREDFTSELRGLGPEIDHPIWYIRTVGLPQSVIESIETFSYKKGEALIETSDCSVCLSEFEDGESLRILPKCTHAFHVACIDMWLESHTNCPLCRAPILVADGNIPPSLSEIETEEIRMSDLRDERVTTDQEMEPVRRSVSLDLSSAVEGEKPFSSKRSMSLSQSIPV